MTQSIVIHGPQGCGKSMNAQRLRRHFGLECVVELDEQHSERRYFATEGALILTRDEATARHIEGVRVLSFKEAMRLAGFTRNPTESNP